jgi:hypothetical protein
VPVFGPETGKAHRHDLQQKGLGLLKAEFTVRLSAMVVDL